MKHKLLSTVVMVALFGLSTETARSDCDYNVICPTINCDSGCSVWDSAPGVAYRCGHNGGYCCDCSGSYMYCKNPTSPFYCQTLFVQFTNHGQHPNGWLCSNGGSGNGTHCLGPE